MDYIPKEVRKNGHIYNFLRKGEKSYIYEQYCPDSQKVIAWEVFQIKVDKPKIVFGVSLGEREIFPGNEDFGKWAWSYSNYTKAEEKFTYLENRTTDIIEEE